MKEFPLEFGIGVRGPKCTNDGATRWLKKFYGTGSTKSSSSGTLWTAASVTNDGAAPVAGDCCTRVVPGAGIRMEVALAVEGRA